MRFKIWARLEGKKVIPCTSEEWAKGFEDLESRTVKQTLFGSPKEKRKTIRSPAGTEVEVSPVTMVSTVFLGLNSGFGGKDLWFETMVFVAGEAEDQYQYETYEEAELGHARVVERMEAELGISGRPANEVESQMIQTVLTQLGRRRIEV